MPAVLYGDWVQVRAKLSRTARRGVDQDRLEHFMMNLAVAVRVEVKRHIKNQDLDWVPLMSSTISRKGHDKIYLASGAYQRGIKIRVTRDKNAVGMDIEPSGDHKPSGLPLKLLAEYLEYGTARIQARPLWRPVFEDIERLPQFRALQRKTAFELLGLQ